MLKILLVDFHFDNGDQKVSNVLSKSPTFQFDYEQNIQKLEFQGPTGP